MNCKSMYFFDCMIFNPAGGCAWKCESENYGKLLDAVMAHLSEKKILIKEHDYENTIEIREKIKAAIIKERKPKHQKCG